MHPPAYYGPRTGERARGRPGALRVVEGLTPGYLDDYGPQLEGQYIDITGLSAGDYSLVHQVNADRRIRERSRQNNVASALVRIEWPGGIVAAARHDRPRYVHQAGHMHRRSHCALGPEGGRAGAHRDRDSAVPALVLAGRPAGQAQSVRGTRASSEDCG